MHEALAVQEVDGFGNLQENVQALVVLPLLGEAAPGHPVLQVLLAAQLHLDVQVHLPTKPRDTRASFKFGSEPLSTPESMSDLMTQYVGTFTYLAPHKKKKILIKNN